MTRTLQQVIGSIEPFDELEEAHREDALAWIASGSPIYRTAKPATPPKHLVAYCALVDPLQRSVLLVDHRDAGLWLTTGGHVDPGEDSAAAAQRELREELALSPRFVGGLEGAPLFITCTVTEGVSAGHTDVSLWYVFAGSEADELQPDPAEFVDTRWWPMDEVRHGENTRFDPNLPRFSAKLLRYWDGQVEAGEQERNQPRCRE